MAREMRLGQVTPELLVEVHHGSKLVVATLTPRAQDYMVREWPDHQHPNQPRAFEMLDTWLYPFLTSAVGESLIAVVRKGRS
jgi:hypothetical protein